MIEPRRLSDEGGDEFERSLLDSARSDAGSELALERALRAIAPRGPAGGASGPSAGLNGAPATLVKTVGALFAAGLVVVALVNVRTAEPPGPPRRATRPAAVRGPGADPPEEQRPVIAAAEPAGEGARGLAPVSETADRALSREASGDARSAPRGRRDRDARDPAIARPTPSTEEAPASSASMLAAEVRLLQAARSTLAAGNPAAALGLLDRHAREFSTGILGPEATVLRVEALIATGDARRARAVAERFLAQHPSGAHAGRIRALLR